ncbi:MAG: alpha/beta hydrolase [Acidobacteria bacterium]|nr:alpha/beta hydrolase [Acidobacteriota bacterium]
MKTDQGWTKSADGNRLFWRRHSPEGDPRAALLIVHGLAEHTGRYVHVLDHFAEAGFDCWAHDYRGHGRSPGLRVHVDSFDEFLTDLAAVRTLVGEAQPDLPLFLVGHSQGGLITLRDALIHPTGLAGIVVSSPFLGVHPSAAPPPALHMVANIVSTFVPKLMFSKPAEPSALSHDPAVPEAYINDPLVSDTVSARWFTSVLRAHADTLARAPSLTLPTLVMQSGDDLLADPAATRRWVANAPDHLVDYVEWDGLYHEMFNEPEKEEVFDRMEAWLAKRIEG